MEHNKVKYIIKSDNSLEEVQTLIQRIKNGDFENSEVDGDGKILPVHGSNIPGETVMFKDVDIIKYSSHVVFTTQYGRYTCTHRTDSWQHFYISMDEGIEFFDLGKKSTTDGIAEDDLYQYCVYGTIPEWYTDNTDYIELDDIVL